MVAEVHFFRKEETFLHAYAEVGNAFHLLTGVWVDYKLREPKRIYIFFCIFYNVIENQVQENKKFDSHKFVVFSIH